MIVTSSRQSVLTSDGLAILRELDIVHPAARTVIKSCQSVDALVGDGTTTLLLLGSLVLHCLGFSVSLTLYSVLV